MTNGRHPMRRSLIVFVAIAVAVACSGCNWLQWGAGPDHESTSADSITKASAPALISSTVTQPAPTGQVVSSNGLVFVQRDGTLTALDQRTYGVVWVGVLPAGSTVGSVPAIDLDAASNTVFVVVAGESSPQLLGFDVRGTRNCKPLLFWCSPIFVAQLGGTNGPATPPVVAGTTVYANGASDLYAFDARGQNGCVASQGTAICSALWSTPTGAAATGIGPAVSNGVVYDNVRVGAVGALGAFNASNGDTLWTGSLGTSLMTATPSVSSAKRVYVPTADEIDVFAAGGCGSATCPSQFALARKADDPVGRFLGGVGMHGSNVFATNGNGSLYSWPASGCGSASCQPSADVVVNTPAGGSADYAQTVAVSGAMIFLTAQQTVLGSNHVVALALDESTLQQIASWDLGAGNTGPPLASVSVAWSVVYAPTDGALIALHAPPVQPLAALATAPLPLKPAFSSSTFDYTVACSTGTNSLVFDMTAVPGGTVQLVAPTKTSPSASQSDNVDLLENQAAVVRAADAQGRTADYWVRCLPHDFPAITVANPSPGGPTPGWYLLGDNNPPPNSAAFAMVLDSNGTPVWYRRAGAPINVTPLGHDTVAYFTTGGFSIYNLDNDTTQSLGTVNVPTDFHELYPAPNGNYWMMSYPLKGGVDLTGMNANPPPPSGPNSTIVDCVLQEVDPQGNLVWQWIMSDHVDPQTETTLTPVPSMNSNGTTAYDVFHCNSIDPQPDGNVLASARHANALYEIRRSDGEVVWKMGGTSTNKDGATIIQIQNDPYGGFVMQHDARMLPNGDISVFDNHTGTSQAARGVEYSVDFSANTAQPVFSYTTSTNAPSRSQGDFRRMSDGHSIVGWGNLAPSGGPMFTEIDRSGNDVFDVSLPAGTSYRSVKAPTNRFDINVLRATAGQ